MPVLKALCIASIISVVWRQNSAESRDERSSLMASASSTTPKQKSTRGLRWRMRARRARRKAFGPSAWSRSLVCVPMDGGRGRTSGQLTFHGASIVLDPIVRYGLIYTRHRGHQISSVQSTPLSPKIRSERSFSAIKLQVSRATIPETNLRTAMEKSGLLGPNSGTSAPLSGI